MVNNLWTILTDDIHQNALKASRIVDIAHVTLGVCDIMKGRKIRAHHKMTLAQLLSITIGT